MGTPPFRVTSQPAGRDGQTILCVKGAISTTSSAAFQEAALAATAPKLIIDLSEAISIDSMAIGALVRVFVTCHKSGRKLALVGLNHRVRNVLRITGVEELFDTYATIREAEEGLA